MQRQLTAKLTLMFSAFSLILGLVVSGVSADQVTLPLGPAYTNPMAPKIPDPFIFRASNGRYYAYGTTGFKAWSSSDLVNWQSEGTVYRKSTKSWGTQDFWAPEVVEYNDKFYLFYTAAPASGSKRIGVAVSDKPVGPFADVYNKPLIDYGYGVIDPHVLIDDDGRKYLYFSRAASEYVVNGVNQSHIYVVELGDDLVSVKGDPIPLIKPQQPWENSGKMLWNEGGAVLKHNGMYYLMYSANCYCNRNYSVGYATSTSPTGPFEKYKNNPILSASEWGNKVSGPGHNSVVLSPDGSEWLMAYHTHIDPAAGGGARQLNVDRMGFRTDGSMYVNGPSRTPQPVPSGASDLRNAAPEATITASSTKDGYQISAVTDGEIGFYARNEAYEWASADAGPGSWVQLNWAQARYIRYVLIYDSALPSRKIKSGSLIFSDGTTVNNVVFPTEPGAAAVVAAPNHSIQWVKFVADELLNGEGTAGVSEIMALDYPEGSVWLTSPEPDATISRDTPITITAYTANIRNVQAEVDGNTLYQGALVPQNLLLRPSALQPGKHTLRVSVTNTAGTTKEFVTAFYVKHLDLQLEPDTSPLHGVIRLHITASLPADENNNSTISLTPVQESTSTTAEALTIYSGKSLPQQWDFNSTVLTDGVYELRLTATSNNTTIASLTRRITVDNWVVKDDELLPPTQGWFGEVDNTYIKAKSSGWEFVGDNPEAFFGDNHRMKSSQDTVQNLDWELPGLTNFIFITYAPTTDITPTIALSVSHDGEHWVQAPFKVALLRSANDRMQLALSGAVPEGNEYNYIRFALTPGSLGTQVQLGQVTLTGMVKEH